MIWWVAALAALALAGAALAWYLRGERSRREAAEAVGLRDREDKRLAEARAVELSAELRSVQAQRVREYLERREKDGAQVHDAAAAIDRIRHVLRRDSEGPADAPDPEPVRGSGDAGPAAVPGGGDKPVR